MTTQKKTTIGGQAIIEAPCLLVNAQIINEQ